MFRLITKLPNFYQVVWCAVERAWVVRWGESGIQKWKVFRVSDTTFQDAYVSALKYRMKTLEQSHQFVMQRTRFKNLKHRLGTNKT